MRRLRWSPLRRFAEAANLGSPDTRAAAVVLLGSHTLVVVVPAYMVLSWFFAREPLFTYLICGFAWLATLVGLALVRRGRIGLSARLLLGGLWCTVAGLVLRFGADSVHVGAFAPVIVSASALVRPRVPLLIALASAAWLGIARVLQMRGVFAPPPEQAPDIIAPIAHLAATGGFSAGLVYAFSAALARLRDREAALQESELRYTNLFDQSPDGILLLHADGDIRTVNAAALEMLGMEQHTAQQRSFLSLPFAEQTREAARELSRGARASSDLILHRDGKPRVLSVNATRIDRGHVLLAGGTARFDHVLLAGGTARFDHAGNDTPEVQLTLRDVTQAREQEEAQRALDTRLRRSERMEAFGQLAGGVAHDFNNILTAILGHIDLLRMRLNARDGQKRLEEGLGELERAAERAAAITRQLLLFSRKADLDLGSADVAKTVRESVSLFQRLLREDIRLEVELDDPGTVAISPSAVEQIVMNLVINAGDAVKEGGRVLLRARRASLLHPLTTRDGELSPGEYVCIRVEDDGVGMSPTVLARIFEPFFTTKPPGRGTGLGLATVHGIVRRAGGQVEVHSEINQGTRFDVYLPRLHTEETPETAPSPIPLGNQETILVCEDEETIRNLVVEVLSRHGYRVHTAASSREALHMGQQLGHALDLLLTDVIMPELTGPQLATALKSQLPKLKVLYMSGYTGGLLQDLGIEESGANLLSKPFKASELLRQVATHLEGVEHPR